MTDVQTVVARAASVIMTLINKPIPYNRMMSSPSFSV